MSGPRDGGGRPAERPVPAGPGLGPGGPRRGPAGGGPFGGHGMAAPVEKARDFRGSFTRLAGMLRPQSVRIAVVIVAAAISVVFSIAGPRFLGQATNLLFSGVIGEAMGERAASMGLPPGVTVTKEQVIDAMRAKGETRSADMLENVDFQVGVGVDFAPIARILGLLAGVYLLSALFAWIQNYIMAGVAQRTVYAMRRDVDEKLGRLPLSYFDSHARGDILSRVTNDIDNVANSLQQSLTQLITSVLTIIGVLAMMFSISWVLAVISLLTLPAAMIVTVAIAKRSQKQFALQWARTGEINGHIEEMHTGHAIVKMFGRQDDAIEVFDQRNEQLYDASFRAQFISGIIQPSMHFIGNLNYVAIAVIGGVRVASGTLTLGDIQAFIQYSRQFTQPIIQTASIANVFQSAVASAERVFELLDEEEETPDAATPVRLAHASGRVTLERVSFRYEADKPLIQDLNLEVQPGRTVAIVGPTGAGKTTLVNLLMRFYDVDEGRILLDGVDVRDMTRDDLRGTFGMVLQDTWLFGGTIRENIGYGRDEATDDHIVEAAKAAHADHFIRTLPEGYDTVLDDEASNVSAGERQLLTISRAFLADPEILILDEATSSVDTRTEVLIQKAMRELMQGRTSFVIAHRLSTIRDANTILVMDRGRIIEQGTHEKLLTAKGLYADLYESQFVEAFDEAV